VTNKKFLAAVTVLFILMFFNFWEGAIARLNPWLRAWSYCHTPIIWFTV